MADDTLGAGRRLLFYVLAVALVVVPVLGVTEIYLRFFSRAGTITPEILRNRSLQYVSTLVSKPVFDQREMRVRGWDDLEYRINAKGYRGRDFEVPKPEGTVRVVVYGGSAVFDLGAAEGDDWPHRVERLLREHGHPEVEVINAGIPNHASWDAVGRLFAEGHTFDPDYVVLYAAWNDIKYFRTDELLLRAYARTECTDDPRVHYQNGLDRWLCETSQIYVRARILYWDWKLDPGAEGRTEGEPPSDRISALGPRQYRINVAMFVDLARNIGTEPILVTQARLVAPDNTPEQRRRIGYEWVSLTHEALCEAYAETDRALLEIGERKGVDVIDASSAMTGVDEWFRDHVHLSTVGSQRLARLVADELERRLGEPTPPED